MGDNVRVIEKRSRTSTISVVVLALVLAAGGATILARRANGSRVKPLKQLKVERPVTIEMKGTDEVSFSGKGKMLIRYPQQGAGLSVMLIGSDGFMDVGRDTAMSIGIALVERYRGDGRYVLAPHVNQGQGSLDAKGSQAVDSNSRVTFYVRNLTAKPMIYRGYDSLAEPCTIVLRDEALSGEVDCPAIVDLERRRVAFKMRWGRP